MTKQHRYQVIKGNIPIGKTCLNLPDAVLLAASYDGHAARFVRDKHGFMSFFASRFQIADQEYVPAPCDAFRPWSSLKDETMAKEDVAKQIMQSGQLHFKHKDLKIIAIADQTD